MKQLVMTCLLGLALLLPSAPIGAKEPPAKDLVKPIKLQSPFVVIDPHKGFVMRPCISCKRKGRALIIPLKGKDFDYGALRTALLTLKTRYAKSRAIKVMGSHTLPWRVLAKTLGTIRATEHGAPLFPIIALAVSPKE